MEADWKRYREECRKEYEAEAGGRQELRGGYSSDPEAEMEDLDQIVEEEVSLEEETLP